LPDDAAIKVNRAPVLTLWAAVVAERLGIYESTAADACEPPKWTASWGEA
jgi:hypothetical protein